MPLTWPVGHVSSAILKPVKEEVGKPNAVADLDLIGSVLLFRRHHGPVWWLFGARLQPALARILASMSVGWAAGPTSI